jgi:ApaG protein
VNITIETQARYIARESDPASKRYVFAYTITIRNDGDEAGRLMSRHWWVTDGQGEVQEVQGPGVVGQQPRIPPGDSFRYTSAALLPTPVGAMHGYYDFENDDGDQVEVVIPAFSLSVPSVIH